jgi:hypothetical protein
LSIKGSWLCFVTVIDIAQRVANAVSERIPFQPLAPESEFVLTASHGFRERAGFKCDMMSDAKIGLVSDVADSPELPIEDGAPNSLVM